MDVYINSRGITIVLKNFFLRITCILAYILLLHNFLNYRKKMNLHKCPESSWSNFYNTSIFGVIIKYFEIILTV